MSVVTHTNRSEEIETRPYSLTHLIPLHRETAERILTQYEEKNIQITFAELMEETHRALLEETYCVDFYREWRK